MRSAFQRNTDALVKVGDYYYHGLGVSDEPEQKRWERAATFYQSAVDTQTSALAMWNLGWMYENGIGVPQVRMNTFHVHGQRLTIHKYRTSTSQSETMTWHLKRTVKHIFL